MVWGETARERELARRERELRVLADSQAQCVAEFDSHRKSHEYTVNWLECSRKAAIAERDEAKRLLADAEDDRDEARRMLEVMEADRGGLRQLLKAAEAERDEAQRDAREQRLTLGIVAHNLRRIADDNEPRDESQGDATLPTEEPNP